jgi:glycosyltransferase involved in cell wall biosynthesis
VVASEIGGIIDIVQHERTGLLVPPGDEGALAGALTRVLTDRSLSERLGAAGLRALRESFSWERIVDRWEIVYRRAAPSAC